MNDRYTDPDANDHGYENIDDEDVRERASPVRTVVWIVSALVALLMVSFPLVRALDLADADDPEPAVRDGREVIANRFADDLFSRRSAAVASRWVIPSLYDEVNGIVGDLQARSSADLDRAAISVAAVQCVETTIVDADIECFHAWLREPGAPEIIRVQLVAAFVRGDPLIVDIRRVNVA